MKWYQWSRWIDEVIRVELLILVAVIGMLCNVLF